MDTTVVETQIKARGNTFQKPYKSRVSCNTDLDISPTKRRNSFKEANLMVKDYDRMSGFVSVNPYLNRSGGTNSLTESRSYMVNEEKWEKLDLKQATTNIYIKYFEATEINLDVSFIARFRSDIKFTNDQIVRNHNFFQSIGLALSTIENAPVRIKKLELQNVYGSQKDIGYVFSDYYSASLKKNLVTIIGSTEILGNPVNLVKTVGTGLNDFVNEPINGFKQGIRKGGLGILKGTGSLMKNTTEGTFGTISNFSSSISKGILIFTRDEEFIYKREGQLMSEKPKNIVEGVGFGVKRALKSVEGAMFGVFTQPIKGARREGVKGFFKGTWTGFSGIIVKPIAGGLDFISKTADGIKYNVKIFDEKNSDERIRWPRPFYGYDLRLKTYNSIDSFVLYYLTKMFKKGILKYPFVDSMIINESEMRKILVFTTQNFVLIELKKKNFSMIIDKDEIENIVKFRNGIKIKVIPLVPSPKLKKLERDNSFLIEDDNEVLFENKILEMREKGDINEVFEKLSKLCDRKFDQLI